MKSSTDSQEMSMQETALLRGIASVRRTQWLDISTDTYWSPKIPPSAIRSPGKIGIPSRGTGITPPARFLLALLIAGIPLAIVYIHGVQKGKSLFCLSGGSGQGKSPCLVDGPQKAGSEVIPASMGSGRR